MPLGVLPRGRSRRARSSRSSWSASSAAFRPGTAPLIRKRSGKAFLRAVCARWHTRARTAAACHQGWLGARNRRGVRNARGAACQRCDRRVRSVLHHARSATRRAGGAACGSCAVATPPETAGLQRGVLTIRPVDSTNQRSVLSGLPLSRATSQSATKVGGKGPRLAAGTFPTE